MHRQQGLPGVLKEHSGHESSTIHIMLELNPYNLDDAGRNKDNPLDEKLIVVDEMSMVDTELMYHLVKAVKSGSKLILSGDPDPAGKCWMRRCSAGPY